MNAVNLRGVWASMKHELRQMREQGSGAIVNCSSLGGLLGMPQRAAYHTSKHGVIGLTKSAAVEYAPKGVRINAVCPGVIDTPMATGMLESQADTMAEIMKEQSIGRLGRADEVAAAVLWLCSPGGHCQALPRGGRELRWPLGLMPARCSARFPAPTGRGRVRVRPAGDGSR